jgi:hypothetical protein
VRKEAEGYQPEAFGNKKLYFQTIDEMQEIYNERVKDKK